MPGCKFPPYIHVRAHFGLVRFKRAKRAFANCAYEQYRFNPRTHTKTKNRGNTRFLSWQPQPDSNWCSRLERAVSWASRRWGQNCHTFGIRNPKCWQIITGILPDVKVFMPVIFYLTIPPWQVPPQQESQPHRPERLRLRWLPLLPLRWVQPVEIQFLCHRHSLMLNDHLLNRTFQPWS